MNLAPSAASGPTVSWDCSDASALSTADWKSADPQTVNGVSVVSHNDVGTDQCELDGSTGLVMRTADSVRSLPYNNLYPATMLLADIQASVGGSWDRYTDRCFFQARVAGSSAVPEGVGVILAENATPLDIDAIFWGHVNGTLQYQSEGTTSLNTTVGAQSDMLLEILLCPWGVARFRMCAWPGSFPDPDTETAVGDEYGYAIEGAGSPGKRLAATKWVPGTAAWGLCVFHNSTSTGKFTATFQGWRAGKF